MAGKRVLITGAARGLGRELVRQFSVAKANRIWAAVRDPTTGDALSLSQETPDRVEVVQMDVTHEQEVADVAREIDELDVLINNAAICIPGGIFRSSIAEMEREFQVNYFGAVRVARAFRSALQRKRGLIVNVTSQLIRTAMPALANYSASKSALAAASQAMRAELQDVGVSVCVVCPAGFATQMSKSFPGEKPSVAETATEIIESLDIVDSMVPIGAKAKALFLQYSEDPVKAEQSKYKLTYDNIWP